MNLVVLGFWRRKMRQRRKKGKGGRAGSERRKERVPRVYTEGFYAKYVRIVMVHLSQSVKLFLNFHDLYFYI